MKRTFLFCLSLAVWLVATGQTFTVKNLQYTVNGSGTVTLKGCSGTLSGIVQVPSSVANNGTNYRVNVIGTRALTGQTAITSIYLPQELDTIGQDAFYGCTRLTVILGLKRADVCEAYAFAKTSLAQLKWGTIELNKLGAGAFADCTKLQTVELPATLTELPEAMMSGCTALKSLTMGDGVVKICNRAFAGCSSLTSLTLPASLKEIGDEAFAEMTSLESIELPEAVTKMGANVMRGCVQLERVELPTSLTTLGYGALNGCAALKEVMLSSKLRDIDDKFVFADCPALEKIEVPSGAIYYSSRDGVLCNITGNKVIAYPAALSKTVHPTVRATTQPFAPGALYGCEMDPDLTIPSQMRMLPREVMANTTGLRAILLPSRNQLIEIEERALAHSRDLKYLYLPATLKTIGNAAFEGDDALIDVIAMMPTPPAISDWTFSETAYKDAVLHPSSGRGTAYSQANGWKKFQQIVDDGTTEVELNTAINEDASGLIYNLQGIRVGKPQHGIYIRNGKKIVY